ncbi:MAG: thymidylate synthase [Zetaproteobacteria bacterium CG_4_9_14_3_um_filter_49_83]|nr:MAG: thymidylate synthase [Zetaproteobacteria bacterium CG17_big_fil_post_rev_8_21_14_2_50_50_13]PIV31550.1 MAG: thymidylate synthase [Zetaproteobacteria bacterium CG02_land_8_20_14_3_00_50_9]PIY55972.1 MAG: thymidylate synthase [Zetaproteobacteria bacterium CG_4_10_14_0_8_um_filter_49_80]PJA36352.1 MAG: thymidylate synthase [Zetaproteobacteria bacterium CG_4_9_14_3_um_filter_49_83]
MMQASKLIVLILGLMVAAPAWAEPQTDLDVAGTLDERNGPMTATDKIVDQFMKLNLNPDASDGVDFEEFQSMVIERATARFAKMDANGNGEVTADEYRTFWNNQKAQYYRLKR